MIKFSYTINSILLFLSISFPGIAQFKSLTGGASYYAKSFEGQKTANGEIYSNYDMTCANRTLPFNTYLKVTNLKNNMSTIVRVNDRGPYARGRILDLTEQAARIIGVYHHGVTQVDVEPLDLIQLTPGLQNLYSNEKSVDCLGNPGELDYYSLSVWRSYDLVHALYVANDIYLKEDVPQVFIVARSNNTRNIYHVVISGIRDRKKLTHEKDKWERKGFMKVLLFNKS